jgi:RNA polymerase sigma-70 factor (ECF subfamily)
MARVGVNTSEQPPLENRAGCVAVFQEALGFVPRLIHAQTLLPRLIDAQAKLEGATRLREGHLSRLQKERILLTIASDRNDLYGIAENIAVLSSLGAPDAGIEALLIDFSTAALPAPDLASLRFCRKLARHAPAVCREDIESLRASGLSDNAIFESVVMAALAIYRGTLSVGLRVEPEFPLKQVFRAENALLHNKNPAFPAHRRSGPYLPAPYLSPDSFTPFAILQETHGFIPKFFRSQSLRPDLLQAEIEAVERILLPEDALTRVQKESILLAVSAANLNSYCVAIHSNLLRGLGVAAEEGDQIAVDHNLAALSGADKALIDCAIKLGTRSTDFCQEDVNGLRSRGFTEEQILECVVVTALNNFSNFLQMGLGIEPDFEVPDAFQHAVVKLYPSSRSPMAGDSHIPTLATVIADPDASLVVRAQTGDLEAFEELVRRHTQSVFRTLAAILGDTDEAQDALQDVFLNAFKHIASFEGRSKVSTWLTSIARNGAFQRISKRKDMESLDGVETGEDREFRPRQVRAWQDDPEQSYSKTQVRKLVENGMLQLSPTYRTVLMLRDIEQLSTDEVARRLGLSVPTVKTRLFRGRMMLREWLAPYFSKGAGVTTL